MPKGQLCGHCRQPSHNVRTCAAYEEYVKLLAEVDRLRSALRTSEAAREEDSKIIRSFKMTVAELRAKLTRREARIRELENILGAMAHTSHGKYATLSSRRPDA